jgi:hypothetical protein
MHHLLKTVRHNEMYGELLEVVWVQFSIFKLSYLYTPRVDNSAQCSHKLGLDQKNNDQGNVGEEG